MLRRRGLRIPLSTFPFPLSRQREGLTLIELLVTIVILVTLLAGVLPLVSPNNEARQVREATRQFTSLLMQAQAQAARDGRPVGVGFSDPDGDGMALEAFIIAEPPPFTGFASSSAVVVVPPGELMGPNANAPLLPLIYTPLVNLVFGRGVGGELGPYGFIHNDASDVIPPQMFRPGELEIETDQDTGQLELEVEKPGDLVEIGDELFEIVDLDCDDGDPELGDAFGDDLGAEPDTVVINNVTYLRPQKIVTARWLTYRYRQASQLPKGSKAYRIRRRPMTNLSPSRSTAEAIQFPRGVGIDLDPSEPDWSMGIVFAPNGTVDAYYRDGEREDPEEPVVVMLGRIEGATPRPFNTPFDPRRYAVNENMTDDEVAELRETINLLNGDSRWVTVTPAGRIVGSENVLFDPRNPSIVSGNPPDPRFAQERIEQGEAPGLQRERMRVWAQGIVENADGESGG
jgi:type II secretory pathway pseudopilin PulG